MADAILVINAGSSSLKFSAYLDDGDDLTPLLRGQIEGLPARPKFSAYDAQRNKIGQHEWAPGTKLGHDGATRFLFQWARGGQLAEHRVTSVGHRVVHGGLKHARPVLVDESMMAQLEQLIPLAPLHQPHNLATIRAVAADAPELAQVACFDTSFHRGHSAVEENFALPRRLTESGIRPIRFSRPLVRVHCHQASGAGCRSGSWTVRGRPPGQRRKHVRSSRGTKRGDHDELFQSGWIADGDSLRRPGPWRASVSAG